jgi:hypothetical protein
VCTQQYTTHNRQKKKEEAKTKKVRGTHKVWGRRKALPAYEKMILCACMLGWLDFVSPAEW